MVNTRGFMGTVATTGSPDWGTPIEGFRADCESDQSITPRRRGSRLARR